MSAMQDARQATATDSLDISLLIAGEHISDRERLPIVNPATEQVIGSVACARSDDLDAALVAADKAFQAWRCESTAARAAVLHKAAVLVRERADAIARIMTLEQGKPLAQAHMEVMLCAETFDWYAAEANRSYGRIMPARTPGARHMVLPEPVGPVAAFTPWNFPALLAARKIAPAIAAGCSVILKPAEETPGSPFALGQALQDAGLPAGVLNIVYGNPASISQHLIASPVIRKITFTGSVPVGRHLAGLAAQHLKPCTLELGGHAPVIVMDDADIEFAATTSAIGKSRNAGQVCTSPTRFYVQRAVHDAFLDRFAASFGGLKTGDGLDPATDIGPLANSRRIDAMQSIVQDAVQRGANVRIGGERIDAQGYFWQPTILTDVPTDALALTSEPFGPIAIVSPFDELDEALQRANDVPVGLAGYAFTRSASRAVTLSEKLQVGVMGINSFAVSHTEAPFGGVKDSGYGYEGGVEGLSAFLHHKYVHHS